MKKLMLAVLAFVFISWGFKGHRAIATIAQKHLTPQAAANVAAYLKGETIADVATWADENKNTETAPWHFINLPIGLSRSQFDATMKASENNLYTAILKVEGMITSDASAEQKQEALKYLIHLVGDAHQPMHVAGKEDKGGNTVQVRFEDKGTNLHTLWDSRLIDHEGLSEADIAKTYDTATPAEIITWQKSGPLDWLWESYQLSSELYAQPKQIDEAYYQKYIKVIHQRVEQAAIRLAGELNRIAPKLPAPVFAAIAVTEIKLDDIKKAFGKTVRVSGRAYSSRDIGSMVLVNIGAAYPDQVFTLALKGAAKELKLDGKELTIEGDVTDYRGKPEIIVADPDKIKLQ